VAASARLEPVFAPFQFVDTGALRDDDLELIRPEPRWIDDFLAAAHHPQTCRDAWPLSRVTRGNLIEFCDTVPRGHEPPHPGSGRIPVYHFWMHWHETPGNPAPPLRIAGAVSLRIGQTQAIELYYGHVGYHVYPAARGHNFAARACRMILPLARAHGMKTLWITCNPDNAASRATCEKLGATLVEIIPVPPNDPLYQRGDHEKCRYRIDLR
jgi:tagatose 1,6-diphosphate aldolase